MSTYTNTLPARVKTALDVLEHCRMVETGGCCSLQPTELSKPEAAMKLQAQRVLFLYLAGEMDYGDTPPRPELPPDEPGTHVPVTV